MTPRAARKLARDLRTLVNFIRVYCAGRHADRVKSPAASHTHDVVEIAGGLPQLCDDCRRLLAHALVKRSQCPFDPKPICKKCPEHCYAPKYRRQVREAMRYAGMRRVFTGRIHYLWHLFA